MNSVGITNIAFKLHKLESHCTTSPLLFFLWSPFPLTPSTKLCTGITYADSWLKLLLLSLDTHTAKITCTPASYPNSIHCSTAPTLAKLPNNLSSAYVSRVLVCVKQRDSSPSHPFTKVNKENVTDPINPSVSVILSWILIELVTLWNFLLRALARHATKPSDTWETHCQKKKPKNLLHNTLLYNISYFYTLLWPIVFLYCTMWNQPTLRIWQSSSNSCQFLNIMAWLALSQARSVTKNMTLQ